MVKTRGFIFLSILLLGSVFAQELDSLISPNQATASDGSISTRRDARAISLKIPAPRGQIVDRFGEALASNEVAYAVSLQYEQFDSVDREYVIDWARTKLEALKAKGVNFTEPSEEQLFEHYRHRRWLPLMLSKFFSAKEASLIEPKLPSGMILHPVYRRRYPHGDLAAHIIGYSGIVGKLPTGPIQTLEPLWEESQGRAGLEKLFDRELTGVSGIKKLIFDEKGNKLLEEQTKRPIPGGTIVTTLNLKWQKLAEEVLKNGCKRGAFVVLDVTSGEVLVMASLPSFDLNLFIPRISEEDYDRLKENPDNPLFGRAFQSAYPPASCYKSVVALAALNAGTVSEFSTIYSPAALEIGNHTFKNWNKTPEGDINVRRALARSCNTWFYRVGIDLGPEVFLSLSQRLGLGQKSGLPLIGETAGLVPSNEWMMRHERRRILNGDTANMSIGQGSLLASPLQVAHMMAGMGNGLILPKLSLISQIQDVRGKILSHSLPEKQFELQLDSEATRIVRDGMRDVVAQPYGTGKGGNLSFTTLAGKTGTAQWGPPRLKQRLAWFAGFLPHDQPRFAFAVLYEGKPGETVSGGRMAAPMVRQFFEPLKEEIKEIIEPPKKALVVLDEEEKEDEEVFKAIPVTNPELIQKAIPIDEEKLEIESIID